MTALVVSLTAVPALASTWTVTPGGGFSGNALLGGTAITDTANSNAVTCAHSRITGNLNSGSSLAGFHIGTITAAVFTGCTNGTLGATTVTAAGLPWHLNAGSYASPITSGRVTGIRLNLAGSNGCSAVVKGMVSKVHGIEFRYSNADFGLKFSPAGSALVFSSVTGCGTTFVLNDPATYTSTYFPITPNQTITSP